MPASFLGKGIAALLGADKCTTGSATVADDDEVEVPPRGSNAISSFFGVPYFSLRTGVPSYLVTTPVERGDPSAKRSPSSSSSERPWRTSLCSGG